jgi:hypothetical protein
MSNSRTAIVACVISAVAGALLPAHAAQEASLEPTFTVGLKLWSSAWQSWVTNPQGTGVAVGTTRYQTVQLIEGKDQIAYMPALNYRAGRWLLAGGAMSTTQYALRDMAAPGGFDVRSSRSELDLTAGYAIVPNLYFTFGTKTLRQTYGADRFRWRGPFIGLSGSADLGGRFYIYGNVSGGVLRAQFPAAQRDANGRTRFTAEYRLGEFGLAYAPNLSWQFMRSPVLTLGYRSQYVATKHYALAATVVGTTPTVNGYTSLYDTTRGLAAGLAVQF